MILKSLKSKVSLLLVILTLSFNQTPNILAQGLNKTPDLTKKVGESGEIAEVASIHLPDDYPEKLTQWYNDNMDSRSYVVVDGETHRILAAKDADVSYPIASMSKVAAVYLAYKALDEGTITMDQLIEIPDEIEEFSFNPELSNVGLHGGTKVSVEDLLNGILLASGNDATSALMWHLYGSEQGAVDAIKELLTSWGITNFKFVTTSGAPNKLLPESMWVEGSGKDDENMMSAADVALMSQHLVDDYPQVTDITSAESYIFAKDTDYEATLVNPNLLLPGREYGRKGINGLKSGFTDAAGRNFVATGTENGREIVAVAMGVFDDDIPSYWEIEILLDALDEFPDLYQDENLPTNWKDIQLDEENEVSESSEEETQDEADDGQKYENKRDNPVTNFMKQIFSLF